MMVSTDISCTTSVHVHGFSVHAFIMFVCVITGTAVPIYLTTAYKACYFTTIGQELCSFQHVIVVTHRTSILIQSYNPSKRASKENFTHVCRPTLLVVSPKQEV